MAVTFATETDARQVFSVAKVSRRPATLDFVVSTKSLPHEQNEQVRALMRKILADEFGGVVTHAAKALGISHSIIHEMLAGSRGAGTKVLRALSTHTGRSIDDILHGIGKRLGYHLNEADWWLCTAAFVHLAVRAGRATWYPTWFVGAIPSEIVALWP